VSVNKNGVIPAALAGAEDLDVRDIDVSSLRLEGVAPTRSGHEDVTAPFDGEPCACSTAGADGIEDLTLKFSASALLDAIGPVSRDEERLVTLTGNLIDGEPFTSRDCIVIRGGGSGKNNGDRVARLRVTPSTPAWDRVQRVTYELPEAGDVTLTVVSVTGRKVIEVVRGVQSAGEHTAEWNAAIVPNGVYFYHLVEGAATESTRLLLFR
jgi:hypothetical protein